MLEKGLDSRWVDYQMEKIPNKLSFRIGEVSKLLEVKPYILRYWESEFEQLKPSKLDNKQRLYFHKDVEMLFLIKKLLYRDGFSIRGAKQALKPLKKEFKKIKEVNKLKDRLNQETEGLIQAVSKIKNRLSDLSSIK